MAKDQKVALRCCPHPQTQTAEFFREDRWVSAQQVEVHFAHFPGFSDPFRFGFRLEVVVLFPPTVALPREVPKMVCK